MSRHIKARGAFKGPTAQSRLLFGNNNTSISRTDNEFTPESSAPPTCPASPPSTTLCALGSSQIQDITSESNPEVSRASTPHSISTKTKRKRTAWVYRHMASVDDMQAIFFNEDGVEVWPCRYCAKVGKKKEYFVSGGTTNIEKHLKTHSVFESSPMEKRLQQQQLSIQEAMDSAEHNTTKKRKLTEETPDEKPLDGTTLESLFVRWISTDNQALRLVECPEFRAFLTYLNSNVNVYLANAHSTCGEWILNQYAIEKERIQLRLNACQFKIHISLDIWTSPNSIPILAIIAHYISADNKLESSVLALKEIQGSHDGENIAPIVEEVLEEWDVISKLGYLQMDNASNNDTMIRALGRILFEKHDIKYDTKHHRVRCQGHILNLSVHSFLFVTDTENLEDDTLGAREIQEQLKLIEEWRRQGPLGMLHNFIVYLQASPQRMQRFLKLSKGARLARDNKTRWNSWAKALKVALSHPLHDAIKAYFEQYIDKECRLDELSEDDWELLRHIQEFLESIAQTTKALESNLSTLDNVLPAMDFILGKFEEGKTQFKDHPQLSKMFNSGWSKLDKYYQMTEDTCVYVAALVLNPRYKWAYINKNWGKKKWITKAKRMVQDLWELYKPEDIDLTPSEPEPTTDNQFLLFLEEQGGDQEIIEDEYAHYCSQAVLKVKNLDARDWWLQPTQQQLYPHLRQLALEILSIPAMSAEPERIFSATKLILTDRRNKLSMKMIEALACLKSWYKLKEFMLEEDLFIGPRTKEQE